MDVLKSKHLDDRQVIDYIYAAAGGLGPNAAQAARAGESHR
jgi:hypothetical protein